MRRLSETLYTELERLEPLLGERATLDPGRRRAPTPLELAERIIGLGGDGERVRAFIRGLGKVVRAFADDFPDNIFWDLDYLACCLWRAGGPREVDDLAHRVAALSGGFGNKSELRFRYAHDFLYGYDWARWVARMPQERAAIAPFDTVFLDYLEARLQELRQLVACNDTKYGPLPGQGFRNPFGFCREVHAEAQLHWELSRAGLIPVKAWRLDGERRWDLPFTELRAQAAQRLEALRGAAP